MEGDPSRASLGVSRVASLGVKPRLPAFELGGRPAAHLLAMPRSRPLVADPVALAKKGQHQTDI